MRGALLTLSVLIVAMLANPAIGQDVRSTELIERALQAKPDTAAGKKVAMGKRYYQGLCAYCHGAQGGGNEAHATPALRRQHYSYLLMQMRDLSADHRYSVDIEIVDTLQQLSYDQLSAIADYASRLPMAGDTLVDSEQRQPKPAQRLTPQ